MIFDSGKYGHHEKRNLQAVLVLYFDALFRHIDLLEQRGIFTDPYHETAFSRGAGYLAEILSYVFVKKMQADEMKALK
ncbi:hypothetical protein [Galactobacillus timonensis]|uniref:hypothetical protein n=1 Tax=Galactobacillus timonensis TaxID=2041840 RepID=UPI000C8386BB|nr:hypothetical protein [Galactobacillus timonensis]